MTVLKNIVRDKIRLFKDRQSKAKDTFTLKPISYKLARRFISKYHYLGDSRFLATYEFGIFIEGLLVGCATYGVVQGTETLKGWFGLDNTHTSILELNRLCVVPILNGSNATSYLLGGSIRLLKKEGIRAIVTLADDSLHVGSIYQVCNFTYHGLSDSKTDFYSRCGAINPRGSTKDKQGVWLTRTQKHRYSYVMDDSLKVLLDVKPKPKFGDINHYNCCDGSGVVTDNRFNVDYTCPKCTNGINPISYEGINSYKSIFVEDFR